jgi:hypothetical protein
MGKASGSTTPPDLVEIPQDETQGVINTSEMGMPMEVAAPSGNLRVGQKWCCCCETYDASARDFGALALHLLD